MTYAARLLPRTSRLLGSITLVALLTAGAPLAASADDGESPKVKKEGGDAKELVKDADPKEAAATTQPATTKPAAVSKAVVSPEAKAEINRLAEAYKNLTSLRLAATITSDVDAAGQQHHDRAAAEATFQAPALFRHATREGEKGKEKETLVVGSTGEKLYVFEPATKYYLTADAPKGRVSSDQIGKPYGPLLEQQNPSLLLALSDDAAAEVLRDTKTIDKAEDTKIGDAACPTLKLTGEQGQVMMVAIDPSTHLLRRVTFDVKAGMEKRGVPDVKQALIVVDYAESTPGAEAKKEQFAWSIPPGAKDAGAMVAAGGGGGDSPASALEGKAAPDFKLKGTDGKDVAMSDLKGSVVVLDFWATWCGPCRASLPELNKTYDDKKGAGLKVFAVNQAEEPDVVEKFAKDSKLTIPVLFDSDQKVAEKYSVNGIPQTVVVGKDGVIKKVVIGSGQHDAIDKAVEDAMK